MYVRVTSISFVAALLVAWPCLVADDAVSIGPLADEPSHRAIGDERAISLETSGLPERPARPGLRGLGRGASPPSPQERLVGHEHALPGGPKADAPPLDEPGTRRSCDASEVASMLESGTAVEREWAHYILRTRPDFQPAVEAERARDDRDEMEAPQVQEAPVVTVAVWVTVLETDAQFLRDVGVDIRGLGDNSSSVGYSASSFRVQHTFIDDTQREIIDRAIVKSDRLRQLHDARWLAWSGETIEPFLPTGDESLQSDFGVPLGTALRICPSVSADRRFTSLVVQVRSARVAPPEQGASELVFECVPRSIVDLPDGGTLLLSTDVLLSDASPGNRRWLYLIQAAIE